MCNKSQQNSTRTAKRMKKNFCRHTTNRPFSLVSLIGAVGLTMIAASLAAADTTKLTVRGSGLPVPRFGTLKFDEANLRAGPGREYPVLWQYRKAGLPLLVDAEFGIWRKVVDHEGTSGWIHGAGLSLKRMALVRTHMAEIHDDDNPESPVIALAERNALVNLESCPREWCRISTETVKGWIRRQAIWGLLADESLE